MGDQALNHLFARVVSRSRAQDAACSRKSNFDFPMAAPLASQLHMSIFKYLTYCVILNCILLAQASTTAL